MKKPALFSKISDLYQLLFKSPTVHLSLMYDATENNDPFYKEVTQNYYNTVMSRHKKMPIFKTMTRGVGVSILDKGYDGYFGAIESSGRRNVRKAIKNDYTFRAIKINEHLDEVWEIRKSAPVRQGKLADSLLNEKPNINCNPESSTDKHNYPYFGVFDKEDKLVAYAGCLIAGEIIDLRHYYGHNAHQQMGVVPYLLTSIVEYCEEHHPSVKAFVYGGHIGASATLRRFKKKFNFLPHRVEWSLN